MKSGIVLTKGNVEKIGLKGSFLQNVRFDGDKVKLEGEILDHQSGIEYILGLMISKKRGVIKALEEMIAKMPYAMRPALSAAAKKKST